MSVDSYMAFLDRTDRDSDRRQLLRVITDTRELIALGRREGHSFDLDDIVAASSTFSSPGEDSAPAAGPGTALGPTETTICHYELALRDIPGFHPLLAELANLAIKPPTVDLDRFHAAFRPHDLEWTSMSPDAPGFQRRYQETMAPHWNGQGDDAPGRRDFHLVNLDQHVEHGLYAPYLQAKLRTLGHLQEVFGPEVRFSGSMWYPPMSYRLWHTNEDEPGWRMYLIDFDEQIPASDARSFFRYMNPQTKEIVTLRDAPGMLRFFKVEQRKDRLFWHCIVNGAIRNRWSFGFVVPDDWMSRLSTFASSVKK